MIFIDLDETLIQSVVPRRGNIGRRVRVDVDGDPFFVLERPLAKKILTDCRRLAEVALLTTASRDYAEAMNDRFHFSFANNRIFARNDFILEEEDGGERAIDEKAFPNSILIDNLPFDSVHPKLKCRFLGIDGSRYVQIRTFDGKDPEKFALEWTEIYARVKELTD